MAIPIRPAATVVVLRPRAGAAAGDEPELYMLRRSARSAFMPDALVFPGGRVDSDDGPAQADASYLRAARRECREEASLDLDARPLRWFDTWQTPSGEAPRRFLARFYLAELAPDEGRRAVADGVETHAGRWATPSAILEQWAAEQVDLPPPTLAVLLGLAAGRGTDWAERADEQLRLPILPKLRASGDTVHIVLPHDPEYAALPGESGPLPARVHELPRRFVRRGKRWIPEAP